MDSLLYLNLHVRWSVCLSLFVTLVIKNSVRRSDGSQSRVILITTKMGISIAPYLSAHNALKHFGGHVGLLTEFGSLQSSKGIFANAPSFKNLCLPKTPCLV